MKRYDLLLKDDGSELYRVLDVQDGTITLIDCLHKSMPRKEEPDGLLGYAVIDESKLFEFTGTEPEDLDSISPERRKIALQRYTVIAGILPYISDERIRSEIIGKVAEENGISKQTVRNYLRVYLVYQNISVLAPSKAEKKKDLTETQKIMRWALNKFYYTQNKNPLTVAYTMMLKERYTDEYGILKEHPSLSQFRYFYRKTRSKQTELISRNGLSNYQRNNRPLLGTLYDFAPAVGVGMLDSTVCDIYLVNESGQLVGRPILTLCVDAYSSLICGYLLSWEGGVFSLKELMKNVISDKKEWCYCFGIAIEPNDWPCSFLPGVLVTDRGREYIGENFEQITELGIKLDNLPAYRPELKSIVEKSFNCIQDLYKPYLRGKGVIDPDYQERGVRDYRKDACLTMSDFEKIVLYCIVHYNSKRILSNFPLTKEMIKNNVTPYANSVWSWSVIQPGANLISVTPKQLELTLLPRTAGRFTRKGLIVSGHRYRHREGNYTEDYLSGGSVTVAYTEDDIGTVWLIKNGEYLTFDLICSEFADMTIEEAAELKKEKKKIIWNEAKNSEQAAVDLAFHIEAITHNRGNRGDVSLKDIRKTHTKEKAKKRMEVKNNV